MCPLTTAHNMYYKDKPGLLRWGHNNLRAEGEKNANVCGYIAYSVGSADIIDFIL